MKPLVAVLAIALLVGAFLGQRTLSSREAPRAEELTRLDREIARQKTAVGNAAPIPVPPPAPALAPPVAGLAEAGSPAETRRAAVRSAVELANGLGMRGRSSSAIALAGRPGSELAAFQIDANGQLPPRFGELFALTPAEVAQLQQQLDAVRNKITATTIANATVAQPDPTTVVITVMPLAEAASLRQEWLDAFHHALGDDAFHALTLLNNEQGPVPTAPLQLPRGGLSSSFNYFGAFPQSYTITRTATGYAVSSETGTGRGSSTGSELTRIIGRLGAVAPLVPPGF